MTEEHVSMSATEYFRACTRCAQSLLARGENPERAAALAVATVNFIMSNMARQGATVEVKVQR